MEDSKDIGMDRKLERKFWSLRRIAWLAGLILLVALPLYVFIGSDGSSRLNVKAERVTISTVEKGPFQVYIAVTGTVLPIRTVYLDAVEGGRVERVVREAGSLVGEGDTILELANTNLVLDIMNREAQLFEQSNNLRNTRLAMEEHSLALEADLADLDFRISRAKRAFDQAVTLKERDLISDHEFADVRDEYEYLLRKHDLTLRTQRQDSLFRSAQIETLEASVARIEANLEIVRQNQDNLFLRAPVSGRLTSLNAEIGESKSRGQRLGQIDILDGFKVRAAIDEHYIARLDIDLKGEFDLAGQTYHLAVTKIYPEVIDGRFEVDLEFTADPPADIRRGQTVHIRLELGDLTEAVLLARGGFFQNSGGNWAYVLNESGETAVKRDIRLGQQNPRVFEVLEGLEPGERVITSSYDNFGNADKLVMQY